MNVGLTRSRVLRAALVLGALIVALPVSAQDSPWRFGLSAGVDTRTLDGTLFAMEAHAERSLNASLSVGPTLLVTPTEDLVEVAVSLQARLRWELENWGYAPFRIAGFAGVGVIDANWTPAEAQEGGDDLSVYIPAGVELEYPLSGALDVAGTVLLSFRDLQILGRQDRASLGFLFGFRYQP